MKHYVSFDDNGNLTGFYLDEVHGDSIPLGSEPITEEQWGVYIVDYAKYKRAESGVEPCRLKTEEELYAEVAALPPAPPNDNERIKALEDALSALMGI